MIGRQPALAPLPMGTVRSSDFGANIDDNPEDWYALLLTYAEFARDVENGCLIDDDGFGEYATETAWWNDGPAVLGNAHNPLFRYAWPMVPRDIEGLGLVAFDPDSDPSLRVFPWQDASGVAFADRSQRTQPNLKPQS